MQNLPTGLSLANISIRQKLNLGFGVLVLLTLVLGVSVFAIIGAEDRIFEQVQQGDRIVRLLNEAHTDLLNALRLDEAFQGRWRNEGYENAYNEYFLPIQDNVREIRERLAEVRPLFEGEANIQEDLALVEEIEQGLVTYGGLLDELAEKARNNATSGEPEELSAVTDEMEASLIELIEDQEAEAALLEEEFRATEQLGFVLVPAIVVLALGAGIAIAITIGRSITRPIGALTDTAQEVAVGDLSQRASVTSSDEIGQLGAAFNAMVERVEIRNRDVQAIVDVGVRTAAILDVKRLLDDITDLTKERFGLYHAHIYLLNEAQDTLVLRSGAGYVGRQMVAEKRIIPLEAEQSIVARTARNRDSLIVEDVTQSGTFLPHPLLPDTRSELAVALVARGQLLGVLDVQSDKPYYFDNEVLTVMETLASQIAAALSNAQLFSESERRSRHEHALSTIERQMNTAVDLDDMMQLTARELAKALRVPHTAIEFNLGQNNHGESEQMS